MKERGLVFHCFEFVDHVGNHRQALVLEFWIRGIEAEGGQQVFVVF